MFKTRIFFISMLSLSAVMAKADSSQSIDVINDSHQSIHIATNNPAQSLKIDQWVPAYTRSLIISVMTKLQSPQEMLYAAIVNDSMAEIINAVSAGANVNQNVAGKSPLMLSVQLQRYNAIKCLVGLGAR